MEKKTPAKRPEGGQYFSAPKTDIEFISSGCLLLDKALGGGWAENRMVNVVGDRSTGKTLLAIEAAANFIHKYPRGTVYYREAESAFDKSFAEALGMPMDNVIFNKDDAPMETIEDFFEDLSAICKQRRASPALYILDSLDALSDRAEMDRDMDAGTYGAEKAKKLSQLFRRLVRDLSDKNITLIIISQIRDKIGVTFGRKTTRSGGRALDFYASQILFLSQIGTVTKIIGKVKRTIGIDVKAKCDKNKVGLPFREAEFSIIFGYGMDDFKASADWLKEVGMAVSKDATSDEIKQLVERTWQEIEARFSPKERKYEKN